MDLFIISGSSSGIGKSLAEKALDLGNKVVGISRTSSIQHFNYTHVFCDFKNIEDVSGFLFPSDVKHFSSIYLINNAGTLGEIVPLFEKSTLNIQDEYFVNLIIPTLLCSKFISSYKHLSHIDLKIINISSGAAKSNIDGWSTYNASKAALNQLSMTIQEELDVHSLPIKCYSIAPGVVDTPMQERIREAKEEKFSKINNFKDLYYSGSLVDSNVCSDYLIGVLKDKYTINEVVYSLRDLYE